MAELRVKLQIYEGPLDLLLHLIQKNEVDLDDIPVARITAQYLEYLELMEDLNVEVAADFLVMAATLTHLKARFLLPREAGEEVEDTAAEELRTTLLNPLLERQKQIDYKEAALALARRQFLGQDVFGRGGADLSAEAEALTEGFITASLFDLVGAFRRVADQKPPEPTLKFVVEPKTIGQRLAEIQAFLKNSPQSDFEELCAGDRERGEVVLSFLAVLELARVGFLRLYQDSRQSRTILIFLADPEAAG